MLSPQKPEAPPMRTGEPARRCLLRGAEVGSGMVGSLAWLASAAREAQCAANRRMAAGAKTRAPERAPGRAAQLQARRLQRAREALGILEADHAQTTDLAPLRVEEDRAGRSE